MITYLIVFVFLLAAFGFMMLMLQFSRYKKRKQGCCSSGIEDGLHRRKGSTESSCLTCPNKEETA